jgi:Tfp pilus assembly protein PilF
MRADAVVKRLFGASRCAAVSVSIVLALALGACGGREARMARHMERAKELLQRADHLKAKVELKNVLQIDPRNAEAYFLAGRIAEYQADWSNAYGNYSRAIELDRAYLDAQLKLGRIHLMFGETEKAAPLAAQVLAVRRDDPEARTLSAAIKAANGESAAAIAEAEAVLRRDPAREDATSLLAGVYRKLGDNANAERALLAGIAANPNGVALRLDLAALMLQSNQFAKAERPLQEAARLEPQRLEHQVRLAAYYANGGVLDKAERILRDAVRADPGDEQRRLTLAEFLARKRKPELAQAELTRFLKERPNSLRARLALAQLYQEDNRFDQAERAANLIADILKDNARDEAALATRGKLALANRDARSAIADFRMLLRGHPNSVEYLSLLANAHVLNNEPELARESLARAVELNPADAQVRLLWAEFLARLRDFEAALTEVDAAIKIAPLDVGLLELKVGLQALKRDPTGAEQTMLQLKSATSDQAVGHHRMGSFYLSSKRFEAAIAEFEAALKRAPDAFDSLAGIIQALLGLGKPESALSRLQVEERARPGDPKLRYLRGEVLAAQIP